jgi:hypothetical protein
MSDQLCSTTRGEEIGLLNRATIAYAVTLSDQAQALRIQFPWFPTVSTKSSDPESKRRYVGRMYSSDPSKTRVHLIRGVGWKHMSADQRVRFGV